MKFCIVYMGIRKEFHEAKTFEVAPLDFVKRFLPADNSSVEVHWPESTTFGQVQSQVDESSIEKQLRDFAEEIGLNETEDDQVLESVESTPASDEFADRLVRIKIYEYNRARKNPYKVMMNLMQQRKAELLNLRD